jgi:uncharacterized protein HemX
MVTTKSFVIALCMGALPVLTASAEPPPESEPKPPETEPTDPAQPTAGPATQDEKMTAEVKGRLLAAALGIQMGDAAANVLHQIATTEPLQRGDLRKVADLAEDAVDAARRNTKHIHAMKELPEAEKTEAKRAMDKLDEAHATVRKIKHQVGIIQGEFRKEPADNVMKDAMELHAQLGEAKQAIEKVAEAHGVSTDLGFSERAAAR